MEFIFQNLKRQRYKNIVKELQPDGRFFKAMSYFCRLFATRVFFT